MLDRLDRHASTELVRYTATDVTAAFGQALLSSLACPKLTFQARIDASVVCTLGTMRSLAWSLCGKSL